MGTIFNQLSFFSSFIIIQLAILSSAAGFTVDLIHRDSPKSPFYDPSATKAHRFTNALHRSFARASRFRKQNNLSPNNIQSEIIPAGGEYLMKISIGTPHYEVIAIADTGSDLTWTQCKPCKNCYKQNAPLFDPKQSSTYRALTCQTRACQAVDFTSCGQGKKNICEYGESYGDQSFSTGELAVETFTFGSSSGRAVSFPNKVFGCGFSNAGTFNESASGIIGLGGGPLSIVTQLRKVINGKFSYCLVDLESNSTSKINFGDEATVDGEGVVSTPIVKKEDDTFYYLNLESITVGIKRLALKTKLPSKTDSGFNGEEGNIIIDSGTTLTFLPTDLYQNLEHELVKVINKNTTEDPDQFLRLCYRDTSIDVPTLTFNFKWAKVVLPPSSTFVLNGDLLCLAMVPSSDIAIFGNLAQMNFLIGYDLEKSILSFKPTDCDKHM